MQRFALALLSAFTISPVYAQLPQAQPVFPTPPPAEVAVAPDRPGISEAGAVVAKGYYQMETGISFLRDATGGRDLRAQRLPESVLRLGLSRAMEVRFSTAGYERASDRRAPNAPRTGAFQDWGFGLKWAARKESRYLPTVTLSPMSYFPHGTLSARAMSADARIILEKTLPLEFQAGANLLPGFSRGVEGTVGRSGYTVSLQRPAADWLDVFIEWYQMRTFDVLSPTERVLDAGVSGELGEEVRWDVSVGTGVGVPGSRWFVSFGIAFRGRAPHWGLTEKAHAALAGSTPAGEVLTPISSTR